MGDDQDAHVGPSATALTPCGDDLQRVDVEAGVGLVEDGELRLLQRELEDLHALLLAAGEAVVEVAAGELLRDVRELHRGLDGLAEVLERDRLLAARLAVRVDDHAQVLGDGHARDGDGVLEGHEQAGAGALVRVGLGDVLAVEEDLALGDLEARVAHDRVGQRRLAGAVGAHQRVDLAGADVQVDALEDLLVAGVDVEVLDLEVGHVSLVCQSRWEVCGRHAAAARRTRRARRAWCAAAT